MKIKVGMFGAWMALTALSIPLSGCEPGEDEGACDEYNADGTCAMPLDCEDGACEDEVRDPFAEGSEVDPAQADADEQREWPPNAEPDWPGSQEPDWPGSQEPDWPGSQGPDWPGGPKPEWPGGPKPEWPGGEKPQWPGGEHHARDWPPGTSEDAGWPPNKDSGWPPNKGN